MDTTFSTQIRVLLCNHCGAPLEAPPGGGHVACRYCNAALQLAARDERPLFDVTRHAPVVEPERIARLRAQDGRPLLPPPSLESLVPNGQLAPWKVQEALAVWQGTRREVAGSASYEAAERLLFLTMVLSNHFSEQKDSMRQRAMFESALEVLSLPRHRQMIRGYLCRSAVRAGDLAAAEQWLAPCDPRSDDLQSDSSFRFSRAFLDTARGDFGAVLRVLGARHEEVPIMDAMDPACAVLRANAVERYNDIPAAVLLLKQAMASPSARQTITKFVEVNQALRLCTHSLAQAQSEHAVVAGRAAATAASGGIHKVFYPLGLLFLAGSAFCLVLWIVGFFVDIAPADSIGGVALFTLLPMGLAFGGIGRMLKNAAEKAERLRLHGLSGTGRILSLSPTGMAINHVPQMQITMQIELAGRAPYQASAKMLMHPMSAAALMPGSSVPVRVDPQNPQEVAIETL